MLDPRVRTAGVEDVPHLVGLMSEFYRESGYPLPREPAGRAFKTVLEAPERGRIWVVEAGAEPAGYLVLTLGFSMEYGGVRGFVDDFFVRPALRGRGFGAAMLETLAQSCRDLGVRALLVETGPANHPARSVYARAGFGDSGRMLLVRALAPAIHDQ